MKISTFHLPAPLSLLLCLLLLLSGCPNPESKSKDKPETKPFEGITLRLAVVDDPALAAAVVQASGEWNAQTGAELQVEETTEKKLIQSDSLPADAVICSSHLLGTLAERKLIEEAPPTIRNSADWSDTFNLLKLREAVWGKQVMAVPFGSPVFCVYYRADMLEKLGRRPPKTWSEYEELAKLFAAQKPEGAKDDWCGTIEPLAPGWAGLVLLARAAPYAKHRDNFSTLFNIDTMEPLMSSPPMVQALEELVAASKFGPADPFRHDPTSARAAFWNGKCGMALTWPTAAKEGRGERGEGRGESVDQRGLAASAATSPAVKENQPNKADSQIRVGFLELPGSRRVYNLTNHAWDDRAEEDDPRVPLLSIAGRIGVVSTKSDHADAAFQLLVWLSDNQMCPQISALSRSTTLFRHSHLKTPNAWTEKPISTSAAVKYAEATEAALGHEQWLGALRLPGRAEYLTALDEAVAAALHGEKSALDALLEADAKWQKITERLGVDKQRAAYRHSLGLE